MFIGFVYQLYTHYNYQCYYNKKVDFFYSSIWFSMTLSSFIYIFFALFNIKLIIPLFIGINIIGLFLGWFINSFIYSRYTSKIISKIEKKYNQQHVINTLKKEIEMEYYNENDRKSVETIVNQKSVIKKEKVFNKPSDCSYFSKFILYNRSIRSFLLVNSIFNEGECFDFEESGELINTINDYLRKLLIKCSNLTRSIFIKYLIFNSIHLYEIDKSSLGSNDNSSNNKDVTDFEVMEIRNSSIQHHLASLNCLKDMMNILKNLDRDVDIDNAMICNDVLSNILNNGDRIYKKYLISTNFDKESLEIYILFLRDSM
eukprot:jgi/Orpsp1_1/1183512/evm.model.c7180000085556.1